MTDNMIQERNPDRDPGSNLQVLRAITTAAGVFFCVVLLAVFCYNFILSSGTKETVSQEKAADVTIMDKYDMFVTNAIADACGRRVRDLPADLERGRLGHSMKK